MPGRRAGSGVGKYSAESLKQDSKRFNCQVRLNTLPIGVYYLSMHTNVLKSISHLHIVSLALMGKFMHFNDYKLRRIVCTGNYVNVNRSLH